MKTDAMKKVTYPPLYISLYFLLMSAIVAVSSLSGSLLELIISTVFWGSLYAVGLYLGHQNAKTNNPIYTNITNAVLIIGLLAFFVSMATQDLIFALALFLMWIQAAQNFSLSTRRDLYFAFAVSFFLFMYGAANSKSSGFLFFMIVYVLAGTFALVANHFDALMSKAKDHGSELPGSSVRFSSSILLLSISIIILATLFYLFVPRPAALNYGAFATAGGVYYENKEWEKEAKNPTSSSDEDYDDEEGLEGGGASEDNTQKYDNDSDNFEYRGFENSFDIGQSNNSKTGNELLMYVESPRPLYLRGPVYDRFKDNRWSKRLRADRKHMLKFGEVNFGEQSDDLIVQTITLKQNITSNIFAAAEVRSLNFSGSVIARDSYGALSSPQVIRKGTVYSVKSRLTSMNGRLIADAKPIVSKQSYLQLPDTFNNEIRNLALSITNNTRDDYSKSTAVEEYLRNNYDYTFDTVVTTNDGVLIDDFLFESKQGHCELFATSMVLMLRSVGIPARLATGFSATNMNPITGYYEVRGLDAHAWVEAYIDKTGWMMFEPTAFYNVPKATPPDTTAEALSEYLAHLAKGAQISDPGELETLSLASLLQMVKQLGEVVTFIWDTIKAVATYVWQLVVNNSVLISVVTMLLVLGFYSFRIIKHPILTYIALMRLKRMLRTTPERFIKQCYIELENYFTRKGEPRLPGCTIQEYETILSARYSAVNKSIEEISRIANLVWYSPNTTSQNDINSAFDGFKHIVSTEKQPPCNRN